MNTAGVPTIATELMLLRWAESSTGGASITFLLPAAADLEPFKAMTTAKGGKAGQRFMAALALLGDDERPVEPPGATGAAARPARQAASSGAAPKGGPLSQLAGRWCASHAFQRWVRPVYDRHLGGDGSGWGDIGPNELEPADFARHAILVLCKVDSRRELDHDPAAAERFHDLVRRPFAAFMETMADEDR
ncbi:MAG TPA: hypothetical protein PK306_25020 [Aquabacterium sp.]|nr:hypothetical protein [Aquabacterium sp.]